ncbi:CARDB domain-containing protein [Thermodesulfobacteriota bacterium]
MIGSVCSGVILYGTISATIWAENITTTGAIDKVWAVISSPGNPEIDPPTIELIFNASTDKYEGVYNDFSTYGILSYQWIQIGGSPVTLDDPTVIQPGFDSPYVNPEGETLTFQLTVTDSGGLQATDGCLVTINAASYIDLKGSWISLNRISRGKKSWLIGNFSVENNGDHLNQSFEIAFYLSIDNVVDKNDKLIRETRVDTMQIYESLDISINTKLNDFGSGNYIIGVVDALDEVVESDETNNIGYYMLP